MNSEKVGPDQRAMLNSSQLMHFGQEQLAYGGYAQVTA